MRRPRRFLRRIVYAWKSCPSVSTAWRYISRYCIFLKVSVGSRSRCRDKSHKLTSKPTENKVERVIVLIGLVMTLAIPSGLLAQQTGYSQTNLCAISWRTGQQSHDIPALSHSHPVRLTHRRIHSVLRSKNIRWHYWNKPSRNQLSLMTVSH